MKIRYFTDVNHMWFWRKVGRKIELSTDKGETWIASLHLTIKELRKEAPLEVTLEELALMWL